MKTITKDELSALVARAAALTLDEAVATVQQALEVKAGDVAGMYFGQFTRDNWGRYSEEERRDMLARYIDNENLLATARASTPKIMTTAAAQRLMDERDERSEGEHPDIEKYYSDDESVTLILTTQEREYFEDNIASGIESEVLCTPLVEALAKWINERLAVGKEYEVAVGYDPFLDHPTIGLSKVRETLGEIRAQQLTKHDLAKAKDFLLPYAMRLMGREARAAHGCEDETGDVYLCSWETCEGWFVMEANGELSTTVSNDGLVTRDLREMLAYLWTHLEHR